MFFFYNVVSSNQLCVEFNFHRLKITLETSPAAYIGLCSWYLGTVTLHSQ